MYLPSYQELREREQMSDRFTPRVHGNGFVQLDLNESGTQRLHVFDDEVPRQKVATPIHDHVFNMQSTVLKGTLVHEELEAWHTHPGTHVEYFAQQEPGTQNTILAPGLVPNRVRVETKQILVLGAGSIYTFDAGKLHATGHKGLTATVMQKFSVSEDRGYGRPRVLVPVDAEPDNEFRRDGHDIEFLWHFIERALA